MEMYEEQIDPQARYRGRQLQVAQNEKIKRQQEAEYDAEIQRQQQDAYNEKIKRQK